MSGRWHYSERKRICLTVRDPLLNLLHADVRKCTYRSGRMRPRVPRKRISEIQPQRVTDTGFWYFWNENLIVFIELW